MGPALIVMWNTWGQPPPAVRRSKAPQFSYQKKRAAPGAAGQPGTGVPTWFLVVDARAGRSGLHSDRFGKTEFRTRILALARSSLLRGRLLRLDSGLAGLGQEFTNPELGLVQL